MSRYIIEIYTPQELNHSSYIQTGLFELEAEGWLKTKVVLSLSKRNGLLKITDKQVIETSHPHPKTSFYKLIDTQTGNHIQFATDLYDASFSFSKFALEHCNYIFKRNFESASISQLPIEYQNNIRPFGLSFVSLSSHRKGSFKFMIGLFVTNMRIALKLDRRIFTRLYNCFIEQNDHWKSIQNARNINQFESLKNTPSSNNILFQTRCFPHEDHLDVLQIHQQRALIIRKLRAEFNNQFIGGMIPSPVALRNYSDVISDLPSDPDSYLTTVKNTKYVVYTRGLANSPAWKLAEYLSQGKVIIAEKLTAELPVPLTHRKEVLFFNNEDEIPSLIREAMNNEELSKQLSQNARAYFEQYVHPKQNMKRILQFLITELEHA